MVSGVFVVDDLEIVVKRNGVYEVYFKKSLAQSQRLLLLKRQRHHAIVLMSLLLLWWNERLA